MSTPPAKHRWAGPANVCKGSAKTSPQKPGVSAAKANTASEI